MNDIFFDKLAMLLSTDWFFPCWGQVGLRAGIEQKRLSQRACRIEVERFVGSAENYWQISFDEQRIESTKRAVIDVVGPMVVEGSLLAEKIGQEMSRTVPIGNQMEPSLVETLTELLIEDRTCLSSLFSESVSEHVVSIWQNSGAQRLNYTVLCEQGTGEWDRVISRLTPDLPCMAADFASIEVSSPDRVARFWEEIVSSTDDGCVLLLRNWYEATAEDFVGEPRSLPAWMK